LVVLTKSTPTRKINYLYNATGQKVAKIVTNNSTETMTDYLNGFHYENNILKFFATAEGYVNVTTGGRQGPDGPSYVFSYIYNYTDHLGNIRLSYTNNSVNGITILEENHYYPFGLKHKKYGSVDKDLVCVNEDCYEIGIDVVPPQARKPYQYKYNGQEWQDEPAVYNWYDNEGNLIYEGADFTVSVEVGKKYKLEVIALSDGYKDYTEVEIKLKSNAITILYPNPTSNQVTVAYKINQGDSAYLSVNALYGSNNISHNYVLNIEENETTLDVSSYPQGLYIISLITNGQVSDTTTLIKQ
jgi:hypothetical protein